mmetsp:Transcript_43149/g.104438  ORF Transcript_43149/g.104438 Transcript_43149/m.104438 type:complete len:217 (+) Transcript_43149:1259-1909(+)
MNFGVWFPELLLVMSLLRSARGTTVDSTEAGGAGVDDDDDDDGETEEDSTSCSGVVESYFSLSFLGVDEDCGDSSFFVVSFEDLDVVAASDPSCCCCCCCCGSCFDVVVGVVSVVEKNDFAVDVNAIDDAADIIGNVDDAAAVGDESGRVNNENLLLPPPPPLPPLPRPKYKLMMLFFDVDGDSVVVVVNNDDDDDDINGGRKDDGDGEEDRHGDE